MLVHVSVAGCVSANATNLSEGNLPCGSNRQAFISSFLQRKTYVCDCTHRVHKFVEKPPHCHIFLLSPSPLSYLCRVYLWLSCFKRNFNKMRDATSQHQQQSLKSVEGLAISSNECIIIKGVHPALVSTGRTLMKLTALLKIYWNAWLKALISRGTTTRNLGLTNLPHPLPWTQS
jgi:hypothetical protein